MSQIQRTVVAPTCTPARRGVRLPCPMCGESEAAIDLCLAIDPDDESEEGFKCNECEATFSATRLREVISRWTVVLKWLESMPTSPT